MRRRVAAPLLVLLALVAVVAVAVVPRGLVRATAAQHLLPALSAEGAELVDDADDQRLPGVRAVVGKEEDSGETQLAPDAVGDVAPAPAAASDAGPPSPRRLAPPVDLDPGAGAPASGRAPPQTV